MTVTHHDGLIDSLVLVFDPVDGPAAGPERLRRDFPILDQEIHGHPLVYLDSASTSQKPQRRHRRRRGLLPRVQRQRPPRHLHDRREGDRRSTSGRASRSRGSSTRPTATKSSSPGTRPRRSTSSPTAGAGATSRAATQIVLTEMEHHANLVPWQLLVQERDGDLEFIPITDDGLLRLDVLRGPAPAQAEARRLHPRLEHARHDQPGPRDDRDGARRRGARPRRRRPGRAAPAGRRPGARRRLLRVQRPQDARPDGLRRALGAARAARGDAAVPRRRRDDPRGPPAPQRVQRRSPGSSRPARRRSATRSGSAWRPTT